jgi:antitoxin ParD1/3/4
MMSTRNVVLTERQESLIEALVHSGRYQNASEVMREGLRLIEQREAEAAARLEALRDAARLGTAALDKGDFKQFADADELVGYLNELADRVARSSGR